MSQITTKWIQDGAITAAKLDSSSSFVMQGIDATVAEFVNATVISTLNAGTGVFQDATVTGNLDVGTSVFQDATVTGTLDVGTGTGVFQDATVTGNLDVGTGTGIFQDATVGNNAHIVSQAYIGAGAPVSNSGEALTLYGTASYNSAINLQHSAGTPANYSLISGGPAGAGHFIVRNMDNSINGLDIEDSTANVTDLEVGGLANFNGDATFNINADFNGSVVVGSDTYSGGAVEADNSSINPTLRVTNWSGGNDRIDSNVIYADNSSTWSATMVVSNDASYTAVYVPAGSIETGTGFISSGDYVYATNYLETTGDATIGRTLKAGSTTYNGGAIQADNSSASPTIDASNAGAGSTIVASNSDANFEAISASNTTGGKAIYVPQGSIDTYSGDINSGGQIYASGRLWSGQDTTVGTYLKVWESATVGTDTYPNTTITADNSSASPTIDASNAGAGSTIVVSNSDANFEAISASNTTGGWAIRVPEGSIETVAGSISSGSHVYATSYLHSGGDTTVGQALQVYGPAKISNDVSVTGNLWIGTDASVAGAIRSNGHINSVSGNITADAGGLYANGGAIVAQGVSSYIYSDYYIAAGTDLESTRDTTVGRYLKLSIANLPTSNPGVQGMVWRDGTNLCISL